MNTYQDRNINLPLTGSLSLIYIASFVIAILMAIVSITGIRDRMFIYPTEQLLRTFVSNDVVNLVIGLPALLGSMWLARRGKLIGLLCWTGALFVVVYNYLAYVFAMPLNRAFPIHLALAMLSLYALIGLVASIDAKTVQQRLRGAVPEKLAGGVLAGLGLLFFLRAIAVMVRAVSSGAVPAETELAVTISDFLTTPAWIVTGILLWQRKEFGYAVGPGLLFQASILFIALIIFLALQPVLTSAPFAITDVIVVLIMGLICFVPFVLFVRGVIKQA